MSSSPWACSTWACPAALKTAGLTGKHIVVNVGDAQNYQYIQSGLTDGAMALNSHEAAWLQVDALARHFTGQSMDVDQQAVLPNMLVTKDNLPSADGDFPIVEGYQAQFKALWGLSCRHVGAGRAYCGWPPCRRDSAAPRRSKDVDLEVVARRDPRPDRAQRLRQVHPHQDPRRVPPRGARRGGRTRRRALRPRPGHRPPATTGSASSTRSWGWWAS